MNQLAPLRSVLAWLCLIPLTVVLGLGAAVTALLEKHNASEWFLRSWARAVLWLAGVQLEVRLPAGAQALDFSKTYVLVSNHQSYLDVASMMLAWPGPLRFVAKHSLFRIPIFGQSLRAVGHIPVVRGNSAQAREALGRAVRPLQERVSVLFFAEGMRSNSATLRPFKKGCLAMADAAGVALVPSAIWGSGQVLPVGALGVRPGRVRVTLGLPTPVYNDLSMGKVQRIQALQEEVSRLLEGMQ